MQFSLTVKLLLTHLDVTTMPNSKTLSNSCKSSKNTERDQQMVVLMH